MITKPRDIDAYLKTVPPDRRIALEALRKTIHSLVPGLTTECISYSMPAFRGDKHVIAGFLATKSGCSYFPFSGTTLGTLATDLKGYSQTKSALHFDPAHPLPKSLVKKLLLARIEECEAPVSSTAPKNLQLGPPAREKKTGRRGRSGSRTLK